MELKPRILIAPLNWGLGHAARCIPVIIALIDHDYEPIIASDGEALLLLKKEFPDLIFIELPSYQIKYTKKGVFLKFKLLGNTFKIINAIWKEYKLTRSIIKSYQISGIISDNRMGVFNTSVHSVYMTHQLNVLSGLTTKFSSKLHHFFIKKFDVCWIPDIEGKSNLSGKLGHLKHSNLNLKYLGILSRFQKIETPIIHDLLIILSGPEPQRSILETLLLKQLQDYKKRILFIRGKIENKQRIEIKDHITIVNFMTSDDLERTINESRFVLCRSGYTSIMDLTKLEKQAFFIPTPGQFEQEYLAKRLKKLNIVPSCKQHEFNIEKLKNIDSYTGLKFENTTVDYEDLFSLFNRK